MSIKSYDNLFEYDSKVLQYSQNSRFAPYRINLHISSCLTKKKKKKRKMAKLYTSVNSVAYICFRILTYQILIFISVAFTQTIRNWNALPDSLISSTEGAEDGVAKFTPLVRAGEDGVAKFTSLVRAGD